MKTQSDVKLTDQLERQLTERELGTAHDYLEDVKLAFAAVQRVFGRLQSQARKSKIEFANG
jgi:hypothetical protein